MQTLTKQRAVCELSIGNIGVQLCCNDQYLGARLRQRYQAFAGSHTAQLVLHIDVDGELRKHPHENREAIFRRSVMHFTTPGYEGSIDVQQGVGQLTLSTAYPLEEIEYGLRVAYALLALHSGGLLLHAAGIVREEQTYLFFGHSGSGKTTVARLSTADRVLNDDLVLLLPDQERWIAYATPFSNPTQVSPTGPCNAPVAALLRLVQSKDVRLEPMSSGRALGELVASVPVATTDPARLTSVFTMCQQLLKTVPCHRLHFLPDASFWPAVESLGR